MPCALADRLSSRAERRFNKVYPATRTERESGVASPPSPPVDPSVPLAARIHAARHGHLPVAEQIEAIREEAQEERAHQRYLRTTIHSRNFRPTGPPRHELPDPVPLARYSPTPRLRRDPCLPPKPTLEDRLSAHYKHTPYPPAAPLLDLDFTRKSSGEISDIVTKKLDATIKLLQAIFDKKGLFDNLPAEQQKSLHQLADRLDWASDHAE